MREKKVRAWDKITETYLYSNKFPSMWQFYKELENRGIRHFETEDYTGLKDKNGREIYEGDIVGIKLTGGKWASASIEWNGKEACFGCRWDTDTARTRKEVCMPNLPGNLTAGGIGNPWKVIGNIYENPKLLEAKVSG